MGRPLQIDLPFIHAYRDRHGRWRHYYRRPGCKKVVLPHPDSERFLDAYHQAAKEAEASLKPKPHPTRYLPGTFGLLCHEYTHSADYSQLAESTRREMGYVIKALVKEHGEKRITKLERKHILGWKDAMARKPGAANKMLRTVKRLLAFGLDRGMLDTNPAAGVGMMKLGRYRAWTDEECVAFETRWAPGTLQRTGYALALYTAQRRGDLVRLKWSSIAGDAFRLVQRKTGEPMEIKIHRDLKTALAAVHPRHEAAILTGAQGKALGDVYFGHIMARAIADAGLPDACVLHGLRKTGARIVQEVGGNVPSITGHRSPRMVAEYTRDADQAKLNAASILKWEQKGRRPNRQRG
jgi:integrase